MILDSMNDIDSEVPFDQRRPKTIHRIYPVEVYVVEFTDHRSDTRTEVVFKAGNAAVTVDRNVVQTNQPKWFVEALNKLTGQ